MAPSNIIVSSETLVRIMSEPSLEARHISHTKIFQCILRFYVSASSLGDTQPFVSFYGCFGLYRSRATTFNLSLNPDICR